MRYGWLIRTFLVFPSAFFLAVALAGCASDGGESVASAPIHAAADRGRFIQECLTDKGFPTTVQEDGSLLTDTPVQQLNERKAAGDECLTAAMERYPMPEENDDFKKTLYVEELDVVDCLADHDVVVSLVPSVQAYVEKYSSPNRWSAWGDVTPDTQPQLFEGDMSALKNLELACPNPLSRY